jgi:type II secretory pathway pseudopilin PulG
MVVIMIIGILLSIALPSYLGTRTTASDRAVQADLRTALAAAMTHWAELGTFSGFDVAQAEVAEPAIRWVSPGPPAQGEVAIEEASGGRLLITGLSRSGEYFCVAQFPGSPVTSVGGDRVYANIDEITECTGGW